MAIVRACSGDLHSPINTHMQTYMQKNEVIGASGGAFSYFLLDWAELGNVLMVKFIQERPVKPDSAIL